MKILFLDIDGVLNRNSTKERCCGFLGVDRELAKLLTDWLRSTDVKIVLSSTWRRHPEMWPDLNKAGIQWIDITPDLARKRDDGLWIDHGRGMEIQEWLTAYPDAAYAILDDNSDMLPEQKARFVQTDTRYGIQLSHIEQLQQLFTDQA